MHSIEHIANNVMRVKLVGEVTVDDYERVIPALESEIERRDEIRVIWDLSELETIRPQTIWRDVVFDMRYRTELERIAIIGARRWQRWAMHLFQTLTNTAVRRFDVDERAEAEAWVCEGYGSVSHTPGQ